MKLNDNYIAVEQLEKEVKEGFQTVDVQDNFVYKGRVKFLPDRPVYMGNEPLKLGDTVLFAKYSPDTHEVEELKVKFVSTRDLLATL